MASKEALENITDWIEYFTRLDYVEPVVRGEVKQKFYEAYHKTRPELELIKKDLEELEELKKIMGTPIQDIMKKLKVLNILQMAAVRDELFKLDDDGVGKKHSYVLVDYDSYHASYLTPDEYKLIKEWLGNE